MDCVTFVCFLVLKAARRSPPVLDGMPPVSETAKKRKMDTASSPDRLSALPDELLQHVLSFLPSREVAQTCVLARCWREQWKSVPTLCITDAESYKSAHALNKFVNYFLFLPNRLPILQCDLKICHCEGGDETFQYMELWIRHAISRQVRVLTVCNDVDGERWQAPNIPLVSKHLTRLDLYRVVLEDSFLDFSSCLALEDLKMRRCTFFTKRIFSPSLKRLGITSCDFDEDVRTRISVPSLISLELDDLLDCTPLVESIPSLVSAFIRLGEHGEECGEWCRNGYEIGGCGDDLCEGCGGSNDEREGCILLEGLSYAVNLELIADTRVFTFRKDLKWCPVFSKLKTLLVNEWFMTANFGALLCFLQHSPNLEKLTLQICKSYEDIVETWAGYDLTEQPFASKHLTVEVKCYKVDGRIRKMKEVLGTYGVPPEQIKVSELGHDCWPSRSFSFEQMISGVNGYPATT